MLRRRLLLMFQIVYLRIKASVKPSSRRKAKIESADAVEINADKEIQMVVDIPLRGQPAADINIDIASVNDNLVPLESVDAEEIVVNRSAFAKIKALFMSYKIGQINFVKTIITKLFAKGDSASVEEIGVTDKNLTEKSVSVGYADTTEVETSDTNATSKDFTISTAETTETSATDTEASSSKGEIVYWIEPVFEDGILTIRSVYNAMQTGDILEVI